MIDYLLNFVGTPYKWAGNNPIEGFDCSGLIMEGLKAHGIAKYNEDLSSQSIFDKLSGGYKYFSPDSHMIIKNDLLFFGKSAREISHVAIAYDNMLMLEAGGGDSTCTSVKRARKLGAFVRVRPIKNRKDLIATVRL